MSIVHFSGLDIDADNVISGRIEKGVIPVDWLRVRFEIREPLEAKKIDKWLTKVLEGRWAQYVVYFEFKYIMVIAFEKNIDAVMFKLNDGHEKWREIYSFNNDSF